MIDLATLVALMAAVLGGSIALFVLVRRGRPALAASRSTSSKRLAIVVCAAFLLAFGVSYVTAARASNTQTFAVSGAERWTVGPFLYITFAALFVTLPGRGAVADVLSRFLRTPSAVLVPLVVLTGLVGLLMNETSLLQTAQGLALILGFCLFVAVGLGTTTWDTTTRRTFGLAVVTAGLLTVLLQVGLGSFPALAVPGAAAAIALAGSSSAITSMRWIAGASGAGALLLLYTRSAGSNDPSAGLQLQIAFALLIVVVSMLPLRLRAVAGSIGAVGIVWAIATSPLVQITFGGLVDSTDLTIAQRGYETQAVWSAVTASPLTLLLGLGPGATVDLHASPDAATLLASGRDLAHVPSVHLLTSHVLLKAGLLGLVWLALIIGKLVILTIRELRRPRPGPFDVLLLTLVWCGLACAIPAATFFFSNPLCGLCLGLLIGRSSRQPDNSSQSGARTDSLKGLQHAGSDRPRQRRGRHLEPSAVAPSTRTGRS